MRFTAKQVIVSSTFASALFMLPMAGEAAELKLGMNNQQVKELQYLLKAKGFFNYHTVTGYFGKITEKAVKDFQASVHLKPTGIVDQTTYDKLKGSAVATAKVPNAAGNTLKIGSKGDAVKVLQQNLKTLGYFTYSEITDYYGTITAGAVKKFQQAYGLKADGIAGPETIKKIQEAVNEKGRQTKPNRNDASSKALKLGARGKEVSTLQQQLKLLGYFTYSEITDYYGTITADAVRKFQAQNGLTATGIADDKTCEKIRQAIEQRTKPQNNKPKQTIYLTIGSSGEKVKKVQMKLKELGHFTHPTITGYFGGITAEAVKRFQKSANLKETGIVDNETYKRLLGEEPVKPFDVMHLIADAAELLGTPYVWGGESPETGFDCSGFLVYLFNKQGVSLPRTVAMIWNVGTPVDKPAVGDVVFFETYKPGASHAGIYIGNNQFIHSGSTNGVSISRMDNPYWSQHYLGAKRYY